MAVYYFEKISKFTTKPNELSWHVTKDGASIPERTLSVSNEPDFFEVKGGSLVVNPNGHPALMRVNGRTIGVNFKVGEKCISALYPSTKKSQKNLPITLEFSERIRGVGAYVSFLGDKSLLDPPRSCLAIMWVQLDGSDQWIQTHGEGVTGTVITGGRVTAPFIGSECTGPDWIKAVSFDISIGSVTPDGVVISSLYWLGGDE